LICWLQTTRAAYWQGGDFDWDDGIPQRSVPYKVPTEYPNWLDDYRNIPTIPSFKFDNPTLDPSVFDNSGYDVPSYSESFVDHRTIAKPPVKANTVAVPRLVIFHLIEYMY